MVSDNMYLKSHKSRNIGRGPKLLFVGRVYFTLSREVFYSLLTQQIVESPLLTQLLINSMAIVLSPLVWYLQRNSNLKSHCHVFIFS